MYSVRTINLDFWEIGVGYLIFWVPYSADLGVVFIFFGVPYSSAARLLYIFLLDIFIDTIHLVRYSG